MAPVLALTQLPQIVGLVPNPKTCKGDTGASGTRLLTQFCELRVRPANQHTIAPTSPAMGLISLTYSWICHTFPILCK